MKRTETDLANIESSRENATEQTYHLPYSAPLLTQDLEVSNALDQLQSTPGWLALDTERTQLFYQELITLLQLKGERSQSLIIDIWQLRNSKQPAVHWEEKLHQLLKTHTCIIQNASSDLPFLYEESVYPSKIFDTEIAARLLGYQQYGLGALVEQTTGHRLAKNHGRERWERRPLPEAWLEYAALDVEFLIPVAEKLQAELIQCGRLEWAEQEFSHLLDIFSHYLPPVDAPWRQIKGAANAKTPRSYTLLSKLWNLRDNWARENDLNPRNILSDRALLDFAINPAFSKRDAASRGNIKVKHAYRLFSEIASISREVSRLPESKLLRRPATALEDNRNLGVWERYYPAEYKLLTELKTSVRVYCESLSKAMPDPILVLPGLEARKLAIALASEQPLSEALSQSNLRPWQQALISEAMA